MVLKTVLSYLLTNLSKEILGHVNTETTAKGAWAVIEALFASQSRAKIISTRMALTSATKGTSSVSEYFTKIKTLADEMAAAGRKLEDEEFVSYLLTGLDQDIDSIVSAVAERVEPITVAELHTQLIAHEQRLEMCNGGVQSSANLATKGKGGGGSSSCGGRGGGRRNGGRGNCGGFTRGGGNNGGGTRSSFQPGVFCQICGKEGHLAPRCFKRFDSNYSGPPQKSASNVTTSSYGVDINWYMDTGATDHITGDFERLTLRDKYHGGEQVHAANGSGMEIMHICHSTLRSPCTNLRLKHILHVPQAKKNLLSIHRLTNDNNVFVEFHPRHFMVKQEETRRTLLRGRCEGGLYPL
jgi:histone deacetylase 1/2